MQRGLAISCCLLDIQHSVEQYQNYLTFELIEALVLFQKPDIVDVRDAAAYFSKRGTTIR